MNLMQFLDYLCVSVIMFGQGNEQQFFQQMTSLYPFQGFVVIT